MPAVECCITDALLRRRAGVKPPAEVRVAIIGNVDCGKSTMVGVLTRAVLDDGRGSARSKVGGKLPLATICVILPLVTLFPVWYQNQEKHLGDFSTFLDASETHFCHIIGISWQVFKHHHEEATFLAQQILISMSEG